MDSLRLIQAATSLGDVFSMLLYGTRNTLVACLFIAMARVLLGAALGMLAGWNEGGPLDRLVMSLVEWTTALPAPGGVSSHPTLHRPHRPATRLGRVARVGTGRRAPVATAQQREQQRLEHVARPDDPGRDAVDAGVEVIQADVDPVQIAAQHDLLHDRLELIGEGYDMIAVPVDATADM